MVRRRLAWPRRREIGWDDVMWIDMSDFSLVGLVIGLVISLLVALVIVLLLPLVLFLVEALIVLAGVALLRGTWFIEASTAGIPPERKTWKVKGWVRSRRAVREVASELRAGVDAAPAEGEPLAAD